MTLPMMAITAKELELRGSFRFHAEFAVGVGLMQKGLIDVKPLITHTVGLDQAEDGVPACQRPEPGDEGADRVFGVMLTISAGSDLVRCWQGRWRPTWPGQSRRG